MIDLQHKNMLEKVFDNKIEHNHKTYGRTIE